MSPVQPRSKAALARFHPAFVFLLLSLFAVRAFAGSVTLAWDAVSSPSLAGYMLYYGPSAGNYTTKVDVGNSTGKALANLTDGATYHFVVTAYDATRTESPYSNDVAATVPSAVPVANFTTSTTTGAAPLALNFTSTSTGTITGYAWNFGDGGTSTAQNPSHVYSAAGTYTVALTVTGSGGSNTKSMPNYITATASTSDTSPPTVPGTLVAAAGGTTSVNLTWKASTDNVAVTGYRIERCQGSGCTSFAQIATATGTTYASTGLAAGTTYGYRVRAYDAAGNLSGYSNVATATTSSATTAAGSLSGAAAVSSSPADLTSVGSSDWAIWPGYVHSSAGGSQIRDIAMVGGAILQSYTNDARMLSWSNGMPTASGSSNAGVSATGAGNGFQLTVPADTTARTLTLYVGAQGATGTLTAHLSDGSAADFTTAFSGGKNRVDGTVTLQYKAASAGQTLTVTWSQTGGRKIGNVSLQGAALAMAGSAPPPPPGSTCNPCTIWSASAVPTNVADSDTSAVEVGVKFHSDVAGYVTGVRFYKSSANTGTHVGSLWTASGALLARATFSGETASGWQQVTFSTPVAISANTVYVASYHTNVGRYSGDNGYFATAGVDNAPLHALRDGASGGNGVYAYASTPAFPNQTWNSSNYWVDVLFTN